MEIKYNSLGSGVLQAPGNIEFIMPSGKGICASPNNTLGTANIPWGIVYADIGRFNKRPTVQGSGILLAGEGWLQALSFMAQSGIQSTNSMSFIQASRLTTPILESGTYRIGWSFQVASNRDRITMSYRVQLDDTFTLMNIRKLFTKSVDNITDSDQLAGCSYQVLESGIHFIDIDFKSTNRDDAASIENINIELWKVS